MTFGSLSIQEWLLPLELADDISIDLSHVPVNMKTNEYPDRGLELLVRCPQVRHSPMLLRFRAHKGMAVTLT